MAGVIDLTGEPEPEGAAQEGAAAIEVADAPR